MSPPPPRGEPGTKAPWALISFHTTYAVAGAVSQGSSLLNLDVIAFDAVMASASGDTVVGRLARAHNALAEARSSRGDIICETAGAADAIGEKCVAVRLHCDGRVIVVRRSGVQEVRVLETTALTWKRQCVQPATHRVDSSASAQVCGDLEPMEAYLDLMAMKEPVTRDDARRHHH